MSDSLPPHGLQHARLPYLSPTQTHVHWVSEAIQPSHPWSSPSPPAFNLSQHQGLFQWVSTSHQVAKGLAFHLQHQSFNEYSGLISFRMDWLDLLAVQGTLKSLIQHHSSKASVFRHCFLYSPTLTFIHDCWKNHSLTRQTFVSKVMSLFTMLSRLVKLFFQGVLILWLQSPSAVILEPPQK